ncbi:MAG: threonine/serine exporter family protein [Candidatus Limivivens sp.]|nr:threonine/serine exporter family protein [Candidatus Limivivens sp.]
MDTVIQVLGAFLAILAFSVVIDAPKKYLPYCGMTGAVGWFVYLLTLPGFGAVGANFLGALAISLLSHILARIFKAPVTVFLIPGILILVPGADLYRSVYNFLIGDQSLAGGYLTRTIQIAGMIALAIFITDSLFAVFQQNRRRRKNADDREKG